MRTPLASAPILQPTHGVFYTRQCLKKRYVLKEISVGWTVLPEETANKVADALQPTMLDLIDLHLVGKQAHWTVVGETLPAGA